MNEYLFYSYLKWQKENKDSTIKKLFQLPKSAIIIMIVFIIISISGLILSIKQSGLAYVAILFQFIVLFIFIIYSERILINISMTNLERYRNYCIKLYTWISEFSISEKDDINELMNRIIDSMNNLIKIQDKQKEKIERWMQVLVIPIILAIVNNIISSKTDISIVTAYILTILALFASIYLLICFVILVRNIMNKMRINQYQSFIEDLQGIIDVKFGILSGNNK